ncbi:MAG: spherulation-specific family 4 protein [Pleurocapsa sp.]
MGKSIAAIAMTLILSSCQSQAVTRKPPKSLLPLYIYPNWYQPEEYAWAKVISAADKVPIVAIINPNNGPDGKPPNDDYKMWLKDLNQSNATVLGYVYTKYGDRPKAEVIQDIIFYARHYNVDGIFLDESASNAQQVDYYQDIYDYVRQETHLTQVIINPGTFAEEEYLAQPAADTAVIFENYPQPWEEYQPQLYHRKYQAKHFASLIHSVADSASMKKYIDLAIARNIGYIYVTDDSPDSNDGDPWNSLPSYWQEEVDYIQSLMQKK